MCTDGRHDVFGGVTIALDDFPLRDVRAGGARANALAYGLVGPLKTLGKVLMSAHVDDGGKEYVGEGYGEDEPTPAELCELAAWALGHASSELGEIGLLTEP